MKTPAILVLATLVGCSTPAAEAERAAREANAAALAPGGGAFADGTPTAGRPRDCIQQSGLTGTPSTIRSDRVIDFTSAGRTYRNVLPDACPRMRSEGRIAYRVTAGQLCRGDPVRVVLAGGGPNIGPVCALGDFQPIDPR